MVLKDVLTISISALALLLSVLATIISLMRGKTEGQRALRSQLTDVLSKIISTKIDNAKLYRDFAEQDSVFYQGLSSTFLQQQTFLLDQAMYLTEQIPQLVSAVEYNTLAISTVDAGDVVKAEKLYTKAITTARDNYWKALATRSYGYFLFSRRRFEEGRKYFQEALSLVPGTDNLTRYTTAYTYQMWATSEQTFANQNRRADELFESARNELNGIDNQIAREQMLVQLNAIRTHGRTGVAETGAPSPIPIP